MITFEIGLVKILILILFLSNIPDSDSVFTTNRYVINYSTREWAPANRSRPVLDVENDLQKSPKKKSGYVRRSRRAATSKLEQLWDYAVVPYEIEPHFTGEDRALFKKAMRHWENNTCLKFVERSPEHHPNYIVFTELPCGCCSNVGKSGKGRQDISIGKSCLKFGTVVHELGHVVGFGHEHTRPDRDQHVEIREENIANGQDYNFKKLKNEEVDSLGFPYDYASIMHYSRNTFAVAANLHTIIPKADPKRKKRPEIGQRTRLSKGDIAQTLALYRCPKCGRTIQSPFGAIASPDFSLSSSSSYPSPEGEFCEWRITGAHGERIVLNITSLDIYQSSACRESALEIRNGYWINSPLLKRYCGTWDKNLLHISTGNQMLITYRTSPMQRLHRGFSATYKMICGGRIVAEKGILQSPNYPDDYRPNKECIWRITVPHLYHIVLKFELFDIEEQVDCRNDYLEIRDGPNSNSTLIDKLCGNSIPEDLRSTSNKMWIKFVSNNSVQKAGFSMNFVKEYNEVSESETW